MEPLRTLFSKIDKSAERKINYFEQFFICQNHIKANFEKTIVFKYYKCALTMYKSKEVLDVDKEN